MNHDANGGAPLQFFKGRGVGSNSASRFNVHRRSTDLDWLDHALLEGEPRELRTTVTEIAAKSIISRNSSPDIGFDQSINPFLGCEHGCVYCYARPTHAYLGLSPGLDFETKIFAKENAAKVLRAELAHKSYRPSLIALGANTDPYQPAEKDLRVTRSVLQVLSDHNAPVSITTKSALIVRDIDIIAPMAARGLARVNISLATIEPSLARILDPRANAPHRRLRAISELSMAGIPTAVFASPMIPAINDSELESILEAAAEAGATTASMIVLRLPLEVRDLFVEWLENHFPLRARHVMSLVREMRGGADYDSSFGARMRGQGQYAQLLRQRFKIACGRLGLSRLAVAGDTRQFSVPRTHPVQTTLFD